MSQERGFRNFDKNPDLFMCTFLLEYERPANTTCLLKILFLNYGPNKTSKPNRMQDSLKVVSATFLLVCFLMSKRIFFSSQKLKLIFTEFVLKWKLILFAVPAQIPYLGKSYKPKASQPIRLQDFLISNISRTNQLNSLIFCILIQVCIN